jgi:hypothetical protein
MRVDVLRSFRKPRYALRMAWLMRSGVRGAIVAALLAFVSDAARAESLRVDQSGETMRVDGALREWKGARFSSLGAGGSAREQDDDAALRFALASQGDGLYLAAEVRDDKLVRKASAGAGQDALVLAFSGARVTEIWLHAGSVGREKAVAGVRVLAGAKSALTVTPDVKVVEGPREGGGGYVLEAFIPWRLFASADTWEQARAVLRYEDYDRAGQTAPKSVLTTSAETKPEAWPLLALGTGQLDLLATFLKAQGLSGVSPRFDARADVAGDALEERVLIVDKYVLVYGKHFKDGQSYSFYALPYSVGGGLVSAELLDLTGDGQVELLTRVRQANALGARVLASVLRLGEDNIAPIFAIELKKETRDGFIENELTLDKKARPRRISVSQGRTQGLSETNYRESPASDALPILLPWALVEARSYVFQDGQFVVVEQREKKRDPVVARSGVATEATAPIAPEARPSSGDAVADLIVAIERGSEGKGAVRFKQQANLVPGAARELVFVHGRRIVASGADLGVQGSYLAYGLPVQNDADLLSLESVDLAADGKAELLARYRQSGADGVAHELLVVLAVEASANQRGFRPLLVAEVARRVGDKAIINQVRVDQGSLVIAPGKAQGYTRETYPFKSDGASGIERVLLPWSDQLRRYRLDAGRLRAE